MSNTVEITKAALEQKVSQAVARAAGDDTNDGNDNEYESVAAYGTGTESIPGRHQLTGDSNSRADVERAHKGLQEMRNDDPTDYTAGVEGETTTTTTEAVAHADDHDPLAVPGDDKDAKAYGTGLEGDTTRSEYLKEKEEKRQAELFAAALKDSLEDSDGE